MRMHALGWSMIALAGCSGAVTETPGDADAGSTLPPDAALTHPLDAGPDAGHTPPPDSGPMPPDFWDRGNIPPAHNVLMFKFLNRTNGKLTDAQIFWSFQAGGLDELHSIAEQSTYDMPANASGRMYFFLCPSSEPASCLDDPRASKYFDFIEHTIGPNQYNGNTTRVDAFGIKIAMLLRSHDGFEQTVGEDYATFHEDRAATFQRFIDEVPAEFEHLARAPFAPYRIVEPGRGEFHVGGAQEHYYDAYIDALWAANHLTVPKAGSNGSGLDAQPNLSAAIFRHVGATSGTFNPDGSLTNGQLWNNPSTFYPQAPANYYARFWHAHSIDGKAYGFPYDDVGGYSTFVSHTDPEYLIIAIGW